MHLVTKRGLTFVIEKDTLLKFIDHIILRAEHCYIQDEKVPFLPYASCKTKQALAKVLKNRIIDKKQKRKGVSVVAKYKMSTKYHEFFRVKFHNLEKTE